MMSKPRILLFGVGLIGGSFARALKAAGAVSHITACRPGGKDLAEAQRLGFVDDIATDVQDPLAAADVVVIATPVMTTATILAQIQPHLRAETVVTDVGSAKASIITDARRILGEKFPQFVPGHPIAGTEKSGVASGFAELFKNHRVILCPQPETRAAAVQQVTTLWQATGALVETMGAETHDAIMAHVSHLPHLVAYALAHLLADTSQKEAQRFAAGGFRDLTRIASSPPVMWRDIALANRDALLAALDEYLRTLSEVRAAVANKDAAALEKIFAHAKALRDSLPPKT